MFDLFRSRDKAVRLLLGGLLVVVALSMLTYLIPSYGGGGGGANDLVVAEVGKDAISMPEVQKTLQRQLKGRQIPPAMLPHIVPQIIDAMVMERALAYEARRQGLEITDTDVANTIRNMIPSLFPDGKFAGKDNYAALLAQQNLTVQEFEADLRRQILANRLRDIVLQGIVVTPAEIEKEFHRRNEKIKLDYVKLSSDKLRSQVTPSQAELQQYFAGHAALYQVQEKRALAVLVVDQAKLGQGLNPADADLERMYNQNKERFRVPERVKVRHILLKTTGDATKDAAVKAKADDLLKKIKGGADFADLAKKNSEDPGSASKGGELPDWVQHGQTVPEFDKAAFGMKPNQISDLVKTQYGYHIIQLLAKDEPHLQTLAEVKSQLADEWRKARVNDTVQRAIDGASAALQKDPLHPEKAAAEYNLQLVKVDRYSAGDKIPDVGDSADFQQAVGTLKKGEATPPVAINETKVAMASCMDVFPAHPAAFADVESQVRDAVVREKTDKMMVEKANELYQKASSMGGDLRAAAKALGFEVKTSDEFDRQGAVEGVGPASMFLDTFNKPVGALVGPMAVPDTRVVARIASKSEADMGKLSAQRDAIRDELKNRKGRERAALFEAGLRQTLIRDGKIKIHEDVISRLTSSYAG